MTVSFLGHARRERARLDRKVRPMIPGGPEILIVLAVVLLLFGAKRIPELARSLGSGARQFREGISGEDEIEGEDKVEKLAETGDLGVTQHDPVTDSRKD